MAEHSEGLTGNISRNILRTHGYHYPPAYRLPTAREATKAAPYGTYVGSRPEVTVSPNPNGGIFSFSWQPMEADQAEATLQIRDISGRLVAEQTVSPNDKQAIDLTRQQPGVYFYHLSVAGRAPITGRIIIQ